MAELNNNQILAFNQSEAAIKAEEKAILKIYKQSIKNIRADMMKLNEKAEWTFNELNKFNRLQKLESQILKEVSKISRETLKVMSRTNAGITTNTYNRSWYGYEKEIGTSIGFDKINPELVRQIVRQPYPTVTLADLIKNVGVDGAARIKFDIGQSLLQGEGVAKMARRIRDSLNISINRANKIARTEGLRAQSKASIQADQRAIDKGIDIVRFWDSTLDDRTRQSHVTADGQQEDKKNDFTVGGVKFKAPRIVSENNTSGNTAGETINCRCSTLTEVKDVPETMEARASKQKKTIDGLTYVEWKQGKEIK